MRLATSLALAAAVASVPSAVATVGVDVSDSFSEADFKCLQQPGGHGPVEFVVVRAFRSSGSVDPEAVGTIKAALAAGMKHVDEYLFPDVHKDAKTQVRTSTWVALRGGSK